MSWVYRAIWKVDMASPNWVNTILVRDHNDTIIQRPFWCSQNIYLFVTQTFSITDIRWLFQYPFLIFVICLSKTCTKRANPHTLCAYSNLTPHPPNSMRRRYNQEDPGMRCSKWNPARTNSWHWWRDIRPNKIKHWCTFRTLTILLWFQFMLHHHQHTTIGCTWIFTGIPNRFTEVFPCEMGNNDCCRRERHSHGICGQRPRLCWWFQAQRKNPWSGISSQNTWSRHQGLS